MMTPKERQESEAQTTVFEEQAAEEIDCGRWDKAVALSLLAISRRLAIANDLSARLRINL